MLKEIFTTTKENVIAHLWLYVLITMGLILRVGAALYMGDEVVNLPGIYDQISYDRLAQNLVAGNGFSFDVDWWPATRAGEPTAHWSYLMTSFLALVYTLFGHHPLIARLIQALTTGALVPWFAYRISKRVFRKTTALISSQTVAILTAAWVGFYGYFIYYGAALMTESFFILAILWSLDAALRISQSQKTGSEVSSPAVGARNSMWLWIELGISFSVAVLLRQAYLLFLPFLLLWLWWAGLRKPKQQINYSTPPTFLPFTQQFAFGILAFLLVLSLFILPFTIFNYQRFDRFVLLNTNSGYAFFLANHPVYRTKFVPLITDDMPSYQDLLPVELLHLDEAALEQALLKFGIGFVTEDPGRYLLLTLSRFKEHFIFWPKPSSHPISNITRVGSLGLALPFSILGFGIWINDWRKKQLAETSAGVLLLLFYVIYNGIYLGSWAGIRYRLPTDPVLVMFAAYGLYNMGFKLKIFN